MSLLSGGIDSPVASWMIAKRGIALEMVHFFSYPYTSEEAKQKVLTLAKLLTPWCGRLTVHVVPFTAIQEELRRKCPEELFTVLMRRFMMRIAEAVAQRCGAGAIVTGECLGQVASQTMEAMRATTAVTNLPILRPVVGMDKEEIVRIARRINTFETSILPYEDCCTVFTPRHPRLRPVLGELEAAEAALDVEGLVKAAVDGIRAEFRSDRRRGSGGRPPKARPLQVVPDGLNYYILGRSESALCKSSSCAFAAAPARRCPVLATEVFFMSHTAG